MATNGADAEVDTHDTDHRKLGEGRLLFVSLPAEMDAMPATTNGVERGIAGVIAAV